VTITATCSSGVALGGGAQTATSNAASRDNFPVVASYPSSTTVWTAEATANTNFGGGTGTATLTAWVLCSQ
jgi:hypothetical protein